MACYSFSMRAVAIALILLVPVMVPAAAQDDFWTQLEAEAVEEWRWPAEQGDAVSQYNLGLAYFRGEGVEKDERQAAGWFRRAADACFVGLRKRSLSESRLSPKVDTGC